MSAEDTLREALCDLYHYTADSADRGGRSERYADGRAALDELVAERDRLREECDGWMEEAKEYNRRLKLYEAPQPWEARVALAEAMCEKAEAERDRYKQALRPFVEDYDFHAADYLADRVDGEEARVFTARTVDALIADQRRARAALDDKEQT